MHLLLGPLCMSFHLSQISMHNSIYQKTKYSVMLMQAYLNSGKKMNIDLQAQNVSILAYVKFKTSRLYLSPVGAYFSVAQKVF